MDWGHWFLQVALWLDSGANLAITPGSAGAWADETLSSRAYRMWAKARPWGLILMPVIDKLYGWQKLRPDAIGHCHNAYLNEIDKMGLPPEMRKP